MSKPWMSSKDKQALRRLLMRAQNGICAGCGVRFGARRRTERSPYLPTLDHVVPRTRGGKHVLANLLLKHKRCNVERRNAPATGCDLIWQMAVAAFLDAHPEAQHV